MDQIFANMNFNKIGNTKLIVGSHPWNAADIFDLHEYNGVKAIENLQQSGEPDRGDIDAITVECAKLGIWYPRVPIQDGSRQSVRANLAKAVRILDRALTEKAKNANDTVYLHCCKGLGRSPSVAAAYLYWFPKEILTLDEACRFVEAERPHSTADIEAIRGATYDILERDILERNNVVPDNFQKLSKEAFRNITAEQRRTLQQRVTQHPAVLNA